MEEQEEGIIRRRLYYTGKAFIKYRGEIHRPRPDEKGGEHYRLEHYYDIEIDHIRQVSETHFSSLPEVLRLDDAHGKIHACHDNERYELEPDVLLITGKTRVAHEQVEGGEIHGYFEAVPVAFQLEREETIFVSSTPDQGKCEEPLVEDERRVEERRIPKENPTKSKEPRLGETVPPVGEPSGSGCLRPVFALLLITCFIGYFGFIAGSGIGSAFLIWLGIVWIGMLIRLGVTFFQRFPRTGNWVSGTFRWMFSLLFLLFFVNGIIHLPDSDRQTSRTDENNHSIRDTVTVQTIDPVPGQHDHTGVTDQDAQRKQVVVHMRWKDRSGKPYGGSYALYADEISTSGRRLRDYQAKTDYTDIYSYIGSYDKSKLNGVFAMLDSIRDTNGLSGYRFAEVIVTMVQSIDYVLILEGSCNGRQEQPAIVKLLRTGVPCLGDSPYGLRTPLQFLSDMKGDCDTRTVVLYNLLKHYGYDVAVINSEYYMHSMLGLNMPGIMGACKIHEGKRYYFWETTGKGFSLGELPRETGNITYWNIELNEQI